MDAPVLLKTEEVAALLRVHPKHVYRLLKQGLPARRVGAEWRFDREEVMRWSRAASPGGPEGAGAASPAAEAGAATSPPLVAANGDLVVRVLLRLLGEAGLLLGLVEADRESGVRLLEARRIPFREIDVAIDDDLRGELIERTGRRTVPQIFIDGESIGGFEELAALDAAGELAGLTAAE